MGKFRTKVKGAAKGKRWRKGQSSSSNPTTTKYRDMAKSKFFHENLGTNSGLTTDAIKKHNAIQIFGHGLGDITKKPISVGTTPTESEYSIAKSLEEISLKDGGDASMGDGSESGVATFKTFQTFASDWSSCSNASFTRLLRGFDPKCALHKEMLAILAAITEVIKEKGGSETSTEYYAALMETLRATDGDEGVCATISLLSMGLKSVPKAVLRNQFSDAMEIFMDLLEKYSESDHNVILRCLVGCLSVFLRAQDYATWSDSSTMKVFDSLLAFTIHSKPKVRKAAQHAVCAVLRGTCFMLPSDDPNHKIPSIHPASSRVAMMCKGQLKEEMLNSSQTTVLHTLTLLKEVIPLFSKEYIKSSCESLLSLMTQNDILIKTWCLRVLHSLFSETGSSSHLTAPLAVQLVRALTACRPNAADPRQTLAWVTVMQQAFVCLAGLDMKTCMTSLPMFAHICVTELWLSDKAEITGAASNALKAILIDCVRPACETEESAKQYWSNLESIFKSIKTGLDNPFNQSTKHVILTIAVCFEVGNLGIKSLLAPLLIHLNERRESHNFTLQKEMEYATGCAVKHLGPAFVLLCIPLRNSPTTLNLDRSWLLPVFKNNIRNTTLEFFTKDILELASLCRNTSKTAVANNDNVNSHTYDLLCAQFWSLLPNFCTNPSDISTSFKNLARILGSVLKDNVNYRPSVMQGLRKLVNSAIESDNEADKAELSRFAKNFLPLLLNVYMTPAKGSAAEGQRLAALETIQVYISIAPENLQTELFQNALSQLEMSKEDLFKKECLLDVLRLLVLYQNVKDITSMFDKWVFPLCEANSEELKKNVKKEAKKKDEKSEEMETENSDVKEKTKLKEKLKMIDMEHKKAYRILEEIFKCDKENCKTFLVDNRKKIQKMLIQSLHKAAESSKGTRLRCIEHLIKSQPHFDHESKLIKSALPEAVICTKDINSKCRQTAFDLINVIGETLQSKTNGLDHFTTMLEVGLNGPVTVSVASIWCLASATYNFSAALGIENLQRIMENICQLLKTTNRQIVSACLAFLKVYTKSLPAPFVAGSLPVIFNAIAEMTEDCKRHARTDLSNLLTRLMRKYGAETIGRLIPEYDEGMQRKLRYMRKMDSRKKRQKELRKAQKAENDSDEEIQVKGSSMTLEEILKDSDSELDLGDDEENDRRYKTKKGKSKKTNQAWIKEDPDNIIDLMDPSSAKNITASKPSHDNLGIGDDGTTKTKKKKEIKTTPDGKLILDFGNNDSDSDDNRGTKRKKDSDDSDDSDSDDDASAAETKLLAAGKKRKFDDIRSTKSGKSGFSVASSKFSKYKAGGKGIHRNTTSSVKSHTGSEYRAKKAKGDVKKKGQPDPYAYLPLARNALNKRKKMKHQKQFVNIMRGAKKGAAAGRITKAKMRMKNKK